MKIASVSHVLYQTYDRDAACKFFAEAFDCEFLERGDIIYAVIGDVLIEMMGSDPTIEEAASGGRYLFGVTVEDLEEAMRECERNGSRLARPISTPRSFWGRQAVMTVPGGYPIALREWRAPDGPHFHGWHPEEAPRQ